MQQLARFLKPARPATRRLAALSGVAGIALCVVVVYAIAGSSKTVAVVAFVAAAVLAGAAVAMTRTRAREAAERRSEADLAVEMARLLLRGGSLEESLPVASARISQLLDLPAAEIRLDAVDGGERQIAFALREGSRRLGTLLVPAGARAIRLRRLQDRVVPALEALLSAALEREGLQGEVVETEALRRADAVKTAVLRAVSHDLRSPLTAISTAGEAVALEGLSEHERSELAGVIIDETRRLARLVENLLDLSRLEAGAAQPRLEWTSIDEVIRAALAELAPRDRDFNLSLDEELPLVRADAAQLERAFVNVFENAARHSHGQAVAVRARVTGSADVAGWARDRSRRGPRARHSARRARSCLRALLPRPGSRPGAQRLRSRAGHRTWLRGGERRHPRRPVAPRPGCDLHLRAAVGRGARRRSTHRARAGARDSMNAHAPRVLVVDDEGQIVRALKVVLREAGFDVVSAETAAEALDRAAVRPPEAAIVDLVLPDGDGVEVTQRLREWSDMPIVVLSAIGEEEQKVRALEAGADDYVTKPFGARELVARLQAALRRAGRAGDEPATAINGLEIDLAARSVRRDGSEIHLTPIEFDLLRMLVRNRGRLLTHRMLLAEVWGPEYVDDIQPLRTHIARLRAKIEPGEKARYIVTDPGVGYRFAR